MKNRPSGPDVNSSDNELETLLAETRPELFEIPPGQDRFLERMLIARRILGSLHDKVMQPTLVHLHGQNFSKMGALRPVGDVLTVGRTASSDWCVSPSSGKLSARHFAVRRHEAEYVLTDLESTNGLQVNENPRMTKTCVLHHGDMIHAGGSAFLFLKGQ